jgi:hypothetical protein
MTLFWPNKPDEVVLDQPRMHALVIGAGDYPHLSGGGGDPAVANFGLQQLTTTVFTGKRIANWLAKDYRNPNCGLGSVELLLSPAEDVVRPDGSNLTVETSNMDNIREAFKCWYARCNCDARNIAFFYFAGHGLSTASQYLLASDFGSPTALDLWEKSIDFGGMRVGMKRNAADTQLFFIDACREAPIDALIHRNPSGVSLCSATIFDQVATSAAYYAAADGAQAFGPSDGVTFFALALLDSLGGAAGRTENGACVVDTLSLANALGQIMAILADEHTQPLTCNPDPDGRRAVFHFPDAPLVRVSIGCRSPKANAEAEISLRRGADLLRSPRGERRPWIGKLRPGDWDIELSFHNFPLIARSETLMPPVHPLEEPV